MCQRGLVSLSNPLTAMATSLADAGDASWLPLASPPSVGCCLCLRARAWGQAGGDKQSPHPDLSPPDIPHLKGVYPKGAVPYADSPKPAVFRNTVLMKYTLSERFCMH